MAMKQARIGLLLAAAILTAPSYALAQKGGAKPAKPAKGAVATPAEAAPAPAPEAPATPSEIDADAPADGEAGTKPADEGAPTEGGLEDICQIDPSACPNLDLGAAAKKPLDAQIYAVQQIYALRYHRFELQPAWSVSLNDQFVAHPAPVLAANYYLTNVMAVGINGAWYQGLNNDLAFNAEVRRAARVAVPLTEYQWAGAVNFTYVPVYGKFAGFSDFIFHYDAYVVGGVGAISTRPVAVVDPDNRKFDWKPKVAFNAGVGLRIFFNRWFAAILEVRDYIFADQLEATTIAAGSAKADSGTWYGDNKLTNNIQAQVGVSVFLPFSWEYRLPK
jgi:outer membrane beta-barrel protein